MPLESDAAELYGPPDGYLGSDGVFRKERRSNSDKQKNLDAYHCRETFWS